MRNFIIHNMVYDKYKVVVKLEIVKHIMSDLNFDLKFNWVYKQINNLFW